MRGGSRPFISNMPAFEAHDHASDVIATTGPERLYSQSQHLDPHSPELPPCRTPNLQPPIEAAGSRDTIHPPPTGETRDAIEDTLAALEQWQATRPPKKWKMAIGNVNQWPKGASAGLP